MNIEDILRKKAEDIAREQNMIVEELNRRQKQILAQDVARKIRLNKREAYELL